MWKTISISSCAVLLLASCGKAEDDSLDDRARKKMAGALDHCLAGHRQRPKIAVGLVMSVKMD